MLLCYCAANKQEKGREDRGVRGRGERGRPEASRRKQARQRPTHLRTCCSNRFFGHASLLGAAADPVPAAAPRQSYVLGSPVISQRSWSTSASEIL